MKIRSLLSRETGETLLQAAQQNLEAGSGRVSYLFIGLASGKRLQLPLRRLASRGEKEAFLMAVGLTLAKISERMTEALLVSEGCETITLIGRNAPDTHRTCVIRPFSRHPSGKFIWEPLSFALYNESTRPGHKALNVLNALFVGHSQG